MASLINDQVIAALRDQIASGCVNKELFTATLDLVEDLCSNYDQQVAAQNEQMNLLQAAITGLSIELDLCCGGGGGGSDFEECGPVANTSLDLTGQSVCSSGTEFTISMSGTNGDNNAGANAIYTGDIVIKCDGNEVARRSFALTDLNLNNGASYGDSTTFAVAAGGCTGVITTELDNVNSTLPNGGTATADVCISANCSNP